MRLNINNNKFRRQLFILYSSKSKNCLFYFKLNHISMDDKRKLFYDKVDKILDYYRSLEHDVVQTNVIRSSKNFNFLLNVIKLIFKFAIYLFLIFLWF